MVFTLLEALETTIMIIVDNDYPEWDAEGIDMFDEDGDGIYEVTLTLKPATYEFKYINGNTWDVGEASVDSECAFGEDGNRQVQVQGDLVLEPVCFNSCIPCQSVTDEESFAYIGSFGDNLYYLSDYATTWENANTYLSDNFVDAHLVAINSAEENDFVSSSFNSGSFWIGLNDFQTEGVWEWVTGEEVTYTNWNNGEPNDLGNEDVVEMLTGGKWNDLQANNNRRFIVEVTTYENIPPSEFSLIAPEDNATFALTDDLDILVDLRWQASQDPDSDVNYFVNLHGSAVVGGETVTWKTSMSELTNQNEPMVNVRFDDNQDVWNQGWSSWPPDFQNMGFVADENGNLNASVTKSNDEGHPDNYLMQVISADDFDGGAYHLSAMLSSPASNFIGTSSDEAVVYVKTFAQTGGQELLTEIYGGWNIIANPDEEYKAELFFEVPAEAVEVHMGLAYFSSNVEGATVYVDDFQLVAPYEATSMALDTSYFEDQFARLATLPNYVQSIDYSWSVVASDGTMDGWVQSGNILHFTVDNQRTGATRDYHVSVEGSDINGDGTVDNPLRNIQTAINLSGPGSDVLVGPGTYQENLVWDGKSLKVMGVQGPEETIINGGLADNVIRLLNLASTDTLMGLTLTNGKAIQENVYPYNYGSGALIHEGSLVVLKDVNVMVNDGVGVYVREGNPTLDHVTIQGNTDRGIEFSSAASSGTLKNTKILEHQNGPGIFIYDTGIELDNCIVANNTQGGIQYSGVGFSPTIVSGTVFAENGNPNNSYGAINFHFSGGDLQISNSVFYHNMSQNHGADINSNGGSFNEDYTGNNIVINNSVFSSLNEGNSIWMADNRDIPSVLTLTRTTFSSSDLNITGALNTVQEDSVFYDILPIILRSK